ncbi:MAG: zinc-dependent metalloprotease [Bacteroidales bacterium]|nr:zinc-dependent metalloprotease [Bacteroidales bacterium]
MIRWRKYVWFIFLVLSLLSPRYSLYCQESIRTLRVAYHIFQDDAGLRNFNKDSVDHMQFLNDITNWINNKVLNLDTLKPVCSSTYVHSLNIKIRIDSIFFHQDSYAWNCEEQIDSEYMRRHYIDKNSLLTYRQKFQTLPIFIGGNYPMVGGHNSLPGNKRYIAMRGLYNEYVQKAYNEAVYECARNLLHEIGHSLGLSHNFQGGEHGNQCDECEDNGCPLEGTSNNIMDYWPAYGHALSVCQLGIVNSYLDGNQGNISDVLINDSCYIDNNSSPIILSDQLLEISDTTYLHQALEIEKGGVLLVKSYLSLPDGESIIIHPGGEIHIHGGAIGNLCGDLWEGIFVRRDSSSDELSLPKIEIVDSGIIEYARTGLSIDCQADIRIDHASFRDCITSIDIVEEARDTLVIKNCTFLARRDYPHSDDGSGLQRFIKCSNGNVIIDSCDFINQDLYRANMADGAGNGIEALQCNLHLHSSLFENLNRGILHRGQTNTTALCADNLTFSFCVAGIQLFGSPVSVIKNCNFRVERFNEQPAFGLYAEEIGWLNMLDNHIYSQYGGDQQVAVLIDHSRGGTQLIHGNSIRKMSWGILHLPGVSDPVWPEDIFNRIDQSLLNRGLGVVLVNNRMKENHNNYSVLLPDGRGVTSGNLNPDVSVSYFADAVSWTIGGLALLSPNNEVAMIEGRSIGDQVPHIDANFYLNSTSNKDPDYTFEHSFDNWFVQLHTNWLAGPFPYLSPASTVEEWAKAEEQLSNDPTRGRSSKDRDQFMESVKDWPSWVLARLANLSAETQARDSITNRAIYSLAVAQMQAIEDDETIPDMNIVNQTNYTSRLSIPISVTAFKARIPRMLPSAQNFDIYPNPASAELFVKPNGNFIDIDESLLKYAIINSSGRVIITSVIKNFHDLRINIASFSSGEYAILIWTYKTFFGLRKFIILRD